MKKLIPLLLIALLALTTAKSTFAKSGRSESPDGIATFSDDEKQDEEEEDEKEDESDEDSDHDSDDNDDNDDSDDDDEDLDEDEDEDEDENDDDDDDSNDDNVLSTNRGPSARSGKSERGEQIQTQAQENLVERVAERLENRFVYYNRRLTSLLEKLQTRIDRMTESGYDTTEAQQKLDEAYALLDTAQAETAASIDEFESEAGESESVKELVKQAIERTTDLRETYKEVIKLIQEVVQDLRDALATEAKDNS